jgi:hypothetical protein
VDHLGVGAGLVEGLGGSLAGVVKLFGGFQGGQAFVDGDSFFQGSGGYV